MTNNQQFHRGAPQDEALARLAYAVEHRLRAALVGPSGVGKSTLLTEFAREQRRRGAAVALIHAAQPREMLWSIAAQWGLFPARQAELFVLWRDVTDRLVQLRYENSAAVILLDELGGDEDVTRCLRQLAAADAHPEACLAIVAAVEAEAIASLPRGLKELIDLRIELEPWELEDTSAVVAQVAPAAEPSPPFTADTLDELYALTTGLPRQVTRLARFASLAATAQQLSAIDSETLYSVQEELLLS